VVSCLSPPECAGTSEFCERRVPQKGPRPRDSTCMKNKTETCSICATKSS
jgi:hypothetical protein